MSIRAWFHAWRMSFSPRIFLLTVMLAAFSLDVLDVHVDVCVFPRVVLLSVLFSLVQFSAFLQRHFFGFTSTRTSTRVLIKIATLRTIFPKPDMKCFLFFFPDSALDRTSIAIVLHYFYYLRRSLGKFKGR